MPAKKEENQEEATKPNNRMVKPSQVKVRVTHHAISEGGVRYEKGDVFDVDPKRAEAISHHVEPVESEDKSSE